MSVTRAQYRAIILRLDYIPKSSSPAGRLVEKLEIRSHPPWWGPSRAIQIGSRKKKQANDKWPFVHDKDVAFFHLLLVKTRRNHNQRRPLIYLEIQGGRLDVIVFLKINLIVGVWMTTTTTTIRVVEEKFLYKLGVYLLPAGYQLPGRLGPTNRKMGR